MASLTLRSISRLLHQHCRIHRSSKLQIVYLPCSTQLVQSLHTNTRLLQVGKEKQKESSTDIDVQRDRPYEHLTLGQKVARAGTDLTYILIVIAGIGITGLLFYMVGSELFSSSGHNAVYSAAFKKCLNSTQVLDALGQPVKAHGEVSRRGRRRHIQHMEFMTNTGEEHTRIKFYLEGAFRSASVHAEMFKNSSGKMEFEYLLVELEGYPPRTIELERRVTQLTLPELSLG